MKVGIIGGGAAGMMSAITAAKNGHNVTIIEHNQKLGKKILATGNGKCNFTNQDMNLYHFGASDEDVDFIKAVYSRFDRDSVLSFFNEIGIAPFEKNGYYYPRSEQASSVAEALYSEVLTHSVNVVTECNIKEAYKDSKFVIATDKGKFKFDKLIIAAGSMASPKTGSDGSGYNLAKAFGHRIIKPLPALCGLKCEGKFFKGVAGVRCRAMVSLYIDDEFVRAEEGELQLTDYGVSGIPVFQISADAVRALDEGSDVSVEIDFYKESSDIYDTEDMIRYRIECNPDKTADEFLNGVFNKKLIQMLISQCGINLNTKCSELNTEDIECLAELINTFNVKVLSPNADNAQICSGGINCNELKNSLESKLCDGLYFAGEIIDVNGDCGGYNLQWAWSSGYVAGCLE